MAISVKNALKLLFKNRERSLLFSLDVTDPYEPKLLWESSYDKSGDKGCSGTAKNCNMGNSKGVAIGAVQIGNQLKDYLFFTSSWISKNNIEKIDAVTKQFETCTITDTSPTCVYGITAYALDMETGQVIWAQPIPYSGDAVGINETPAVPALMDRDNNGSYDYVVFGDMQGRLWALRTLDGKNLTGSTPVYQVKELTSDGSESITPTGAKEPIGAAVSVYRDYVVLATGGADMASSGSLTDARTYRVEVVKIGISGGVKDNNQTVVLAGYDGASRKGNEKVWAKPAITSDLKVYVGTARSYYNNQTVATLESDGRILVIDLRIKRDATQGITNVAIVGGSENQWHAGGFVGGFDFDHKHAYIVTLKPTITGKTKASVLQIGSQTDFSNTTVIFHPHSLTWFSPPFPQARCSKRFLTVSHVAIQ
jgi:Neisseria PilC beta-propeller domain